MPYAQLALALIIFSAGFGLSNQLDKAEIQALQSAIERGNAQEEQVMQVASAMLAQANAERDLKLAEMEASHEKNDQTINSLHDRIGAMRGDQLKRLQSARCENSGNTAPASESTGISSGTAYPDALSAGLHEFLTERFYQADQLAEWANQAWVFINEQHCGIKERG
jgi:hypothetical protein